MSSKEFRAELQECLEDLRDHLLGSSVFRGLVVVPCGEETDSGGDQTNGQSPVRDRVRVCVEVSRQCGTSRANSGSDSCEGCFPAFHKFVN